MKVALIHDWLTGMRGGEKCLAPFCRIFPDAPLYTLLHKSGGTSAEIERMRITTSFLQRVPGIARHYRYWLPLMPRAIESLRLPQNLDLVLSFSHAVAKSVRPPAGVPHVCYCFTPMRYAWQLRQDYFGHGETPSPVGRARNAVLDRIRRWDAQTSGRVTHFVAISQTIADRISACYDRPSTVIYPPVDTDFYTPGPVIRQDYYLCVSALAPYKRVDLAVRACTALKRRLVVIGAGPEAKRLTQIAGPSVEFLGWRSDEEILDHFRRCRALIFPGHEDFGIVPVEAQACGAPVVAFARGGATETVLPANERRSGTGIFFNEQTVPALVEALKELEGRLRQFSPQAARQQALRFNAARFETQMLDYLAEVLGRGQALRRAA